MIYIASDHAGFELKERIKASLIGEGHHVVDMGNDRYDRDDDYPDFIIKVAKAVSRDSESKGIILGGSGQGEAIAANRYDNVRCVVFYGLVTATDPTDVTGRMSTDPFEIIRLSREHNDANILSLGARFLTNDDALHAVKLWLETPFTNEERHMRRINKIER
ncbi:MAG: RpiB/LacA/LacB family sugar-phosphate isomerase [Dehalococcoidia bacterium]|nr:RpiB/LacA/LacB family sugar-phosphate isomerase [Dehalococcoidia bacterium]